MFRRLRDTELQNISYNAMHAAYQYTSPRARMIYWRQSLSAYKKLFLDMDSWIQAHLMPPSIRDN